MVTNSELKIAGWMSILAALLAIPQLLFMIFSGFFLESAELFQNLISLVNLGIFIFINLVFKDLLNNRAGFFDVDSYIYALIIINIIMVVLGILGSIFSSLDGIVGIFSTINLLIYGIVLVVFGVKLLKCEEKFSERLNLFAYLNIATGALAATIIFILFGILTMIVADIVLAIIFFTECNEAASD